MKTKQCGVYCIKNTANGKIYVGSTGCLANRFYSHKYLLRKSNHANKRLQKDWDEYGESSFVFEILEEVDDIAFLQEKEQVWMDYYKCSEEGHGYNIFSYAGGNNIRPMKSTKIPLPTLQDWLDIINGGKQKPKESETVNRLIKEFHDRELQEIEKQIKS